MFSDVACGVDGCRSGWFFFALEASGRYHHGIVATLQELVADAGSNSRIFIDIPIGLPDGSEGRLCDTLARRKIRQRRSSVFPPPARAVLGATDYDDARRRSIRATGKSIGRQSYAIMPKIRAVDTLLRQDAKARRIVREVHPEVCFWGLNDGNPMQFNKKTQQGLAERIALLERYLPCAPTAFSEASNFYQRKDVALDDILDAMVNAVTALSSQLMTLPEHPSADSEGLPMEMVYASGI